MTASHVKMVVNTLLIASGVLILGCQPQRGLEAKPTNEVMNSYDSLEAGLVSSKTTTEKLDALEKTQLQVKDVRAQKGIQSAGNELEVATLTAVLEEIPKHADFKVEDCEKYRSRILFQYEPTAIGTEVENPAVQRGLRILKKICE